MVNYPDSSQKLTELEKKLQRQTKVTKKLEKELKKKAAALAEAESLLSIQKKTSMIWKDPEDI